ncbi:hypothetical protein CPB84DRAFT_1759396 [Gymnopilus junonius]|uniref:Uncharacterized protein n=1 Tax=Gymnopilus junonius TaxID=109634 RepID=A0A9P5TUC2_GYMJU|nr:hypothetical protein CPB84DRAFT_1759396 [Gymnopilus junonius]
MQTSRKKYVPTPEDLALAKARKEKKDRLAAEALLNPSTLLPRTWLSLLPNQISGHQTLQRVKIFTWNLLAQSLIRRMRVHFRVQSCLTIIRKRAVPKQ